jgi:RNA polymerase sigma-32 factor
MKAVRRFDPTNGVRLVSFAVHWIRAEIHEFIIRNWRMVKIATTKAHRKLFFKLRGHKKEDRALSNAEMNEVAKQLGVRPKDVAVMENRFLSPELSLEPGDQDEDEPSCLHFIAAPVKSPFDELADAEEEMRQKVALKEALLALDDRSREIVAARWLKEPGATLEDLASRYGVSAERIRQIEKKAFKTVREQMTLSLAEPCPA